jgi:hypothetical protein
MEAIWAAVMRPRTRGVFPEDCMDEDLAGMSQEKLIEEVKRLWGSCPRSRIRFR